MFYYSLISFIIEYDPKKGIEKTCLISFVVAHVTMSMLSNYPAAKIAAHNMCANTEDIRIQIEIDKYIND